MVRRRRGSVRGEADGAGWEVRGQAPMNSSRSLQFSRGERGRDIACACCLLWRR